MKWFVRSFFKLVRAILGPLLLFGEFILRPRPPRRSDQEQAALDARTGHLTLYEFRTCPFCIKTRLAIARLGLRIRKRNAQFDQQAREELLRNTGRVQVPCLRIADGENVQWMLESDQIIAYLQQLAVAESATPA